MLVAVASADVTATSSGGAATVDRKRKSEETPVSGVNQARNSSRHEGAVVPVTVTASRTEAELIVGMLRSNGLAAAVSADDAGGQEPQLQIQGVRVLVAASDEVQARRLLAAADESALPDS
jgi:hypothetical protein